MRVRSAGWLWAVALAGCDGSNPPPPVPAAPAGADLSGLAVERIGVGAADVEAWIADDPASQAAGLMFATDAQLAPLPDGTPRGMLFVFATDSLLSFWMRNTFVALDLAYATSDGTIVEVHALTPLDETRVPAGQPVRYALELPQGTLAALGLGPGDVIAIP